MITTPPIRLSLLLGLTMLVTVCALGHGGQAAQLPATLLDGARAAITAGRLDEADRLLSQVDANAVDRNDFDFLRGTVALAKRDFDGAVVAFRAILDRDPSLNRVRLDLARAFFEKGDDEEAEHHFRVAEAAGLPATVQENVDKFLDAIRRRKHWSLDVTVGIAPDTNSNAATSAKSVTIYSLPFDLNSDARQHSGFGVTAELGGSYQYELAPNSRFILGADDKEVDYASHKFDDRTMSGVAGPRFLIDNDTEITILALANRHWFGEYPLNWGAGGRVEGQQSITPHLLMSGAVEGQQITYDQYKVLSGPRISFSTSATYGLDAVSSVKLDVATLREQTTDPAFSDFQYIVGVAYFRDLSFGFNTSVGANLDFARYDTVMAGFGATLHYDKVAWKISLSNRHLDVLGFSPVITYIRTNQHSNLPLYSYSRDQGEIGVTKTF